jgi:hypothetical protein
MKANDDLFEQVKRIVLDAQNNDEPKSKECPDMGTPQGDDLNELLAASVNLYVLMAQYTMKHGRKALKFAQFFVRKMTPEIGNFILDEND